MIVIYATSISTRLQYILSFIFHEYLETAYRITVNTEEFNAHIGVKINYTAAEQEDCINIIPEKLLFEKDIHQQRIEIFQHDNYPCFFQQTSGYPFDIFAACFYLLSRYEEYLPFEADEYGRYPHADSIAYKNNFLHLPLINIWLNHFGKYLQEIFPSFELKKKSFHFTPTYDIDMAWSYQHKGLLRNIGGFVKRPSVERIKVLTDNSKDPFDVYDELHVLHKEYALAPVYFFLMAEEHGKYDKNISPENEAMHQLIREHRVYDIGIHPSWKSFEHPGLILSEKNKLENISEKKISISRQHYIKFIIPQTFRHLIDAGITDDHSMGYGSINGFRASVAHSFLWYDLLKEETTFLRIHPFCFMDANSFFEQKQLVETSAEELMHYFQICKENNGHLITIFHNNFLGSDPQFKGWKEMYQRFTSQLRQ